MEHHQLCKQLHRAPFLPPIWYKNRLFPPDFCHLGPVWPESLLKAKPFTLSPCGSISLWHKKLQPSFIVCHFRYSNRHSRSRPRARTKVNKCRVLAHFKEVVFSGQKPCGEKSLYLLLITACFYTCF